LTIEKIKYKIKNSCERYRASKVEIDLIALTEDNELIIFEYKDQKDERVISQLIYNIAYVMNNLELISEKLNVKIQNPTYSAICVCTEVTEEMRISASLCSVPIKIQQYCRDDEGIMLF